MCEDEFDPETMTAEELSGYNIYNEPVTVKHAELERANDESMFRSICPTCKKGYLMVKRNQKTFKLEADDHCILCGQHFLYADIEELRKKAGES